MILWGYVLIWSLRRDGGNVAKERLIEVLCFKVFYRHFVFVENENGNRKKRIDKYFEVSVVLDMGCGNTKHK